MNESKLTNLDRTPEYIRVNTHSYHTPTMHTTTNIDHNSKSIYNEIHIFNNDFVLF